MVRRYLPDAVPADVLGRVLDAAQRGPSAGYAQGLRLVVVTDVQRRTEIARALGEAEQVTRGRPPWLSVAPVHIVVCTRPDDYRERYAEADKATSVPPDDWSVPFWWVDAGAAVMLLLLAVVDEGLGAGVLQIADPDLLRDLLGIPADVAPVLLVTAGYAAPDDAPVGSALRTRRSAAEVVHRERW